ncbi:MAG: DUF2061 domain-containing protein [bacterium]|nr:DUF2061 domain-containing protein [bacterium]
MSYETSKRSLVKTIVWRVVATLVTLVVVYVFTGRISESLKITLTAAFISMVVYYIHERVWSKINWERNKD